MTIRVAICESEDALIHNMEQRLAGHDDLQICAVMRTKPELLQGIPDMLPDVLLLNLNLSGNELYGLEAINQLQRSGYDMKIIVIASIEDRALLLDAITIGRASNYITKEYLDELPELIRSTVQAKAALHYAAVEKLIAHLIEEQENKIRTQLTPLQYQILQLLSDGSDPSQIADTLVYSKQSIHNEIYKITKLFRGRFPYFDRMKLKKREIPGIVELARMLKILN